MGASAVWAKLIDRFDWVHIIDDAARRDDCKLSVGTRVKALLINIGTDRKALYKVQEFYEKRDTEVLLGEGVSASDLNDDTLGRALDILYDLDMDKLYPRLALHTAQQLRVLDQYDDLLPFHSDTTSISLTGDYACQDVAREDVKGDDFRIARGYSKDHRPDLKQIIFGLSTLGGLPICANVDKGNQDDHTWNFENIPRLLQQIDESIREKSIYIADSAVVTKDNLALLASEKAHFISRFPSTYTLCDTLKQSAWAEDTWVNVGRMGTAKDSASYKIRAFSREFYGKPYRFIVVRSTSLDTRKEHKLQMYSNMKRSPFAKQPTRPVGWYTVVWKTQTPRQNRLLRRIAANINPFFTVSTWTSSPKMYRPSVSGVVARKRMSQYQASVHSTDWRSKLFHQVMRRCKPGGSEKPHLYSSPM